jgi:hypothetical protein
LSVGGAVVWGGCVETLEAGNGLSADGTEGIAIGVPSPVFVK